MSDLDSIGKEEAEQKTAPNQWLKLGIELTPLLIFFGVNSSKGIIVATGAFMVAVVISIFFSWKILGKVAPMLWISAAVVGIFGGLTIYFDDETFIKIKPTIVNGIFSVILFGGLLFQKHFLKSLLQAAFPPLQERGWALLTRNWALFFLAMALVNEFVWRNFSTDTWVSFKVFGFLPLTMVFALAQTPIIIKYQKKGDQE